jgi:hypothetical protein
MKTEVSVPPLPQWLFFSFLFKDSTPLIVNMFVVLNEETFPFVKCVVIYKALGDL